MGFGSWGFKSPLRHKWRFGFQSLWPCGPPMKNEMLAVAAGRSRRTPIATVCALSVWRVDFWVPMIVATSTNPNVRFSLVHCSAASQETIRR